MRTPILLCSALCAVTFFGTPVSAEVPQSQQQMQLSFAPVVKQVAPSVVNIYTKRVVTTRGRSPFFSPMFNNDFFFGVPKKRIENSLGSGVIIDAQGIVITNAHVIKGAEEITVVMSDGREFIAKLLLSDPTVDLAMLQIKPTEADQLPHAPLKASESLEVGDIVLAIGNPFGVGQTVTSGIVSATSRAAESINDYNFFIQTDAAINPGNSGGALVSLDGHVVGINTAIYSRDGGSLGIGFAIPSEMVNAMLTAHQNGQVGKGGIIRPWLGISTQDVTHDIAQSLELSRPEGALLLKLHPASPLKKAGLEVGDMITHLNDHVIRNSREMRYRMSLVPIGHEATVTFRSGNTVKTSNFKSIYPPEVPARNEKSVSGNSLFGGVTFSNLNPAVAAEIGADYTQKGVVISAIQEGSAAARVFRVGDMIEEIDDERIESPKDAITTLERNKSRSWKIIFSRNGRRQTLILR